MFERWRERIMPSATTAESSDSIEPSNAMVIAGEMRLVTVCQVTCGILGMGRELGTLPKRLPIVATGMSKICTTAVAARRATSGPGIRCDTFGQKIIMRRDPRPTSKSCGSTVRTFAA